MNLHRFEDRYGEKPDGCVWRPNCPTNHVALGTVYTKTCTIPARVFHKLPLKIYQKNPAIIFAAEFKIFSQFKFVISEFELHFGNVLEKFTFFPENMRIERFHFFHERPLFQLLVIFIVFDVNLPNPLMILK